MSTGSPPTSKPSAPRYRLYVDESGDHTYKKLDTVGHRYLALLGVWFRQSDYYLEFARALDEFKNKLFGERPDDPVILHRSDIINRHGAFGVLREDNKRQAFDDGLVNLIDQAQFKMVCVLLDKQSHQQQYVDPFHPYHYCLAAMLERYVGWLVYKNIVGDVMAESRGGEEDLQLKQAYRRVYESGTQHFSHEKFQLGLTSKDIKIRPKRVNIAGLQLADVLAYPVRQAVLLRRGLIEDPGDVFGKKVYEVARQKFNCKEGTGEVEGYGYKCL